MWRQAVTPSALAAARMRAPCSQLAAQSLRSAVAAASSRRLLSSGLPIQRTYNLYKLVSPLQQRQPARLYRANSKPSGAPIAPAAAAAKTPPKEVTPEEREKASAALAAVEQYERTLRSPWAYRQLQLRALLSRWGKGARSLLPLVGKGLLLAMAGSVVYGMLLMWNEEEKSWQLMVWKTLPLRFLSHIWGSVHRWTLPVSLRRPLYMWWTRTFHCKLDEMEGGPDCLEDFPNLNSFFIRRIDLERCRPLDNAEMVSPVDARVNCFGEVRPGGKVDQIKGMEYRVEDLLGHALPAPREGHKMYYYVLYLAPGDYHRMHAPFDCVVEERRHFPGALYPVAPAIAKYIPSLFVRNERVVLTGTWGEHKGFMALVPVGAYNVGSMKLTFDAALDTNLRTHTFTQYRPNLQDGLAARPFYRSYKREQRPSIAVDSMVHLNQPAAKPQQTQQPKQEATQAPGAQDTPQQQPVSVVGSDSVSALRREVTAATDEFARSDPAIDPHTFSAPQSVEGKKASAALAAITNDYPSATAASGAAEEPSGKQGAGGLSPRAQAVLGSAARQVGQKVFRVSDAGIHLPKGGEFSRFELGSTIVVLFELDEGRTFNFNIENQQKVTLGQRLGVIVDKNGKQVTPMPANLVPVPAENTDFAAV